MPRAADTSEALASKQLPEITWVRLDPGVFEGCYLPLHKHLILNCALTPERLGVVQTLLMARIPSDLTFP